MKPNTILCFLLLAFAVSLGTTNCASVNIPKSIGEQQSSYSYIPINPLPVFEKPGKGCDVDAQYVFKDLLSSLPDQAIRLAIGEFSSTKTVSYSPATIGYAGNTYKVVFDYISADVVPLAIYITPAVMESNVNVNPMVTLPQEQGFIVTEAMRYNPYDKTETLLPPSISPQGGRLYIIPVYVGVGLRLTADVQVLKGSVNFSGLDVLSSSAESGKLSGSLTIQTLGITGNNVNKILPLPVEINRSTVQNALLSLGSIKAILYEESTSITPRVVGFENTAGSDQSISNGILSLLAGRPVIWYRPCKKD